MSRCVVVSGAGVCGPCSRAPAAAIRSHPRSISHSASLSKNARPGTRVRAGGEEDVPGFFDPPSIEGRPLSQREIDMGVGQSTNAESEEPPSELSERERNMGLKYRNQFRLSEREASMGVEPEDRVQITDNISISRREFDMGVDQTILAEQAAAQREAATSNATVANSSDEEEAASSVDDAQRAAEDAAAAPQDGAEDVRDAVQDAAESVSADAQDALESVGSDAREALDSVGKASSAVGSDLGQAAADAVQGAVDVAADAIRSMTGSSDGGSSGSGPTPAPLADDTEGLKQQLVRLLASLDRGRAASDDDAAQVKRIVEALEASTGPVSLTWQSSSADGGYGDGSGMQMLGGRWRLVYTSNFRQPQVTLGQVYQDIRINSSQLDNVVELVAPVSLASLPVFKKAKQPRAIATLQHSLEIKGSDTVEITYETTSVKLTGGLGILDSLPQLSLPQVPDFLKSPAKGRFRVTFLDENMRISRESRGRKGSKDLIRVFLKD